MAGIVSSTEIQYFISPAARLKKEQIKVRCEGKEVAVQALSSENNEVITGKIQMGEPLDITKEYEVEIEGFGALAAMPTGIFDSAGFAEQYVYEGDDLGAEFLKEGGARFKLWAPSASAAWVNPLDKESSFPADMAGKGKVVWGDAESLLPRSVTLMVMD